MKNIHVIPTDKSSRLQLFEGINEFEFELCSKDSFFNKGAHIYITNSETIKEGDYIFEIDNNITNIADKDYYRNEFDFKIILTTDADLIKDGVQAIDDEFLEWFVKNPSYEWVDVKKFNGFAEDYLIIIPKEEPKQETLEEFIRKESKSGNESVGIIKGAKWQQERMYSEEKIDKILQKLEEIKTMIYIR